MDRKQTFKNNGKNQNEMRRRRTETSVVLRKNERVDSLMKRRNIAEVDVEVDDLLPNSMNAKLVALAASDSSKPQEQLAAVRTIRELVSLENNSPAQILIDNGILAILVACIKPHNPTNLQFEALWALTNIASGAPNSTHQVATSGAVPILIELLFSTEYMVADQAVWALSNIIGDGPEKRDFVLHQGIIRPLLTLVNCRIPVYFMRNIAWVMLNISLNTQPGLTQQVVTEILPGVKVLLQHSDEEVVGDALWAINNLCMAGIDRIQTIIDSDMLSKIVTMLHSNELKIQSASLSIINQMVMYEEKTQLVLDCNALSYCPALLTSQNTKLRARTLLFISNITAGTVSQVQEVIDAGLIPQIIDYMWNGDFRTQAEAAWAISNACLQGSADQMVTIINDGAVPPLCHLLASQDTPLVKAILEGLKSMLHLSARNWEEVANMIEECGGLDQIESLQSHLNCDIYKLAFEIIESYFLERDVEPDRLLKS